MVVDATGSSVLIASVLIFSSFGIDTVVDVVGNSTVVIDSVASPMKIKKYEIIDEFEFDLLKFKSNKMMIKQIARARVCMCVCMFKINLAPHASEKQRAQLL